MSKRKIYTFFISTGIMLAILNFIKLPYFLNLPGDAYELAPIVKVEGGDAASGKFMMTTVGVSRGEINVLTYLWAQVAPHHDLIPSENMRPVGESDKEYYYRQLHMMDMSQNVATAVAYEKAGKQIEYQYNGVFVMSLIEGMDAENKLEIGDRIFKVEGNPLESSEQFIGYVEKMNAGDQLELSLERNGEELTREVKISPFPSDPDKFGVGISLVTDREIDVEPEVTIDASAVGGPSAGLMFTLEIYNQLTSGDLTSGYKIAGTGTINYDGVVGPIGGISHKIIAAKRAGASYFLAPVASSNYTDAKNTAEEIGTEMKVIPVDSLDDAIKFLQTLQQKGKNQ
ncbi:SepM family pheromone-processing serine protease [Bacillus sp. DJP31]|uniref:SepM family pheromone-processing serine protease n=1 Tax=Bacillus sp. DJP31 TaxID=3409789 RepID=UPI003BB55E57